VGEVWERSLTTLSSLHHVDNGLVVVSMFIALLPSVCHQGEAGVVF
jgi:hypothetical protein